jgi:hypothetical protein
MIDIFEERAKQIYSQNPESGMKNPYSDPFEQRVDSSDFQQKHGESRLKSAFRWAAQIPLGIAQATVPGIVSNLAHVIGVGSALDEEELEQLRKIHEREGKVFDEEAYMRSLQQASEMFPTPSNIARMVEEETGLPLTPQTKGQELLQFAATAGKFAPGGLVQKLSASAIAPAAKVGLEKAGVPEPLSELAALIASGGSRKIPEFQLTKTKPSGIAQRGFEKIKEPRTVSEGKISKINKKLEQDFKNTSDRIIRESPVGETAKNLRNDPTFKQESRELLNQTQEIADSMPEIVQSADIKKEFEDTASRKIKGFSLSEYDKNYMKFMKEASKDIVSETVTPGELVQQYRKNNSNLGEYFEPGASKALNRAKRDALLDQNRSIASLMEKKFPDSELVPVFNEGNARWTKIMDVEAVDDFIADIFDGKINFDKMHDFFDKEGYSRIFKRSLGEKGYADFEQLMKDMLTSETPYKMLNIAKSKGYQDLFNTGMAYILHPDIALTKIGLNVLKDGYKGLINSMLDKPQIGITFKQAVKDLRKGKFDAAEKDFNKLKSEVEILPKEEPIKEPLKPSEPKQVSATPQVKQIEHKEPVKEYTLEKKIPEEKIDKKELEARKKAMKKFREGKEEKSISKPKEYIFGTKIPITKEIKTLQTRLQKAHEKLLKMDENFLKEDRSGKPINHKKRMIDIKLKDEQQKTVDLLREELVNEEAHQVEMYKLNKDIKDLKKSKNP